MFLSFCFVLFVILKSLSRRIVRADQHLSPACIYLHLPANVNQESKSQTEEALNGVIGGQSDFQLSVRGPGLLAGPGIVLSHKPTVRTGLQSLCGGCSFVGCTLRKRQGSGLEKLEDQTPGPWAWAVSRAAPCLWAWSKSLSCSETPLLFICPMTSSVLASGETT